MLVNEDCDPVEGFGLVDDHCYQFNLRRGRWDFGKGINCAGGLLSPTSFLSPPTRHTCSLAMSYNGTPGRHFIDLAEDRPPTPVGQTPQYARNTYVKIADHWTTLGGKEVVKGDFGVVSDYYWARDTDTMPEGFVYTVELLGAGRCTPGIHEVVLAPYP